MNPPEINHGALAEVRTALDGMKLKHGCDKDIMDYPEPFKGLLLRDGYIDYKITEDGISYEWTPGALELLNGEPEEKSAPERKEASVDIDGANGISLELTCRLNEAYDAIEVIPKAKYQHIKNAEHRFSTYSLMLRKDVSTMPDGVYGLYIEIPGLPQPRHPLCLFTYPAQQLGDANAERICWEQTEEREFSCEQLGITITLDDSMEVDHRMALKAVLHTNAAYADNGLTLVTVSADELPGFSGAHASYLKQTFDPLMNTHTENAIWPAVPED